VRAEKRFEDHIFGDDTRAAFDHDQTVAAAGNDQIEIALPELFVGRIDDEFAADAAGVKMVGHPYGLISALEKLGSYNKRIPMDVSPTTASLFIVAPLSAGQIFTGLFSTHPPLSDRIAILRNMGGGR